MDTDNAISVVESQLEIPSGAQAKSHGELVTQILPLLCTQEGPLSKDMIVTRICQLLPSKRTKRNRESIEHVMNTLCHQGILNTEYGFYWTTESELSPRIPGNGFRDFDNLYPPHVLDFVRFYLRGSVDHSVHLDELVEILMTLVGWESMSQTRLLEFKSGITQLIPGSNMTLHENVIRLR